MIVELIPDIEYGGFTARVPDIPAYGEGETEDEAISDLQETLRGYVETFGFDDALMSEQEVVRLNSQSRIQMLFDSTST